MLTDRRKLFVDEYLIDLNATQAAIRAGYSKKTAHSQGERLLRNVEVQKAIQAGQKARSNRLEITADRVLQEFARIAFFDPRNLFNEDGTPKAIAELDDDTAAVVAGLDVAHIGNADVGIGQVMKIKLADKKGALDSVARHLGMFNDKMALTGKDGAELSVAVSFVGAKKVDDNQG